MVKWLQSVPCSHRLASRDLICSDAEIPWSGERGAAAPAGLQRAQELSTALRPAPGREEKRKVKEERDRLGDSAERSRATSKAAVLPLHIPSCGRLGQGCSWKCSRALTAAPKRAEPGAEPCKFLGAGAQPRRQSQALHKHRKTKLIST